MRQLQAVEPRFRVRGAVGQENPVRLQARGLDGYEAPIVRNIIRRAEGAADGCEQHPLMRRMHRPGDEKRMVVILDREDWSRWLSATTEEAMALCKTYPAELMGGEPAPAPPRGKKALAPA